MTDDAAQHRLSRRLALIAVCAALILAPFAIAGDAAGRWSNEVLQTAAQHPLLVALIVFALLASDILLPIPSSIVSSTSGYLLGFFAGAAATWAGMTAGCLAGYFIGARMGRGVSRRIIGDTDLLRLEALQRQWGDWFIAVTRPVPVMAEAAILFAGIGRMPFGRFLATAVLSNAGVAVVYAAAGAWSASLDNFLIAFAAALVLPLALISLKPKRLE